MTSDVIISIDDVRVSYGGQPVVDGLSLEIYRGEVFGLLGPNGSGKTTPLAAIQGLLRPDAGRVLVDIDLALTPTINTLPVRRLHPAVRETVAVSAVWLRCPELTI